MKLNEMLYSYIGNYVDNDISQRLNMIRKIRNDYLDIKYGIGIKSTTEYKLKSFNERLHYLEKKVHVNSLIHDVEDYKKENISKLDLEEIYDELNKILED